MNEIKTCRTFSGPSENYYPTFLQSWNDLSKVLFELWKKLLKRFILGRLTLPKVSIVIYVSKLLLIVCCKVSMMVFIITQKNADTYFSVNNGET